MPKPFAANYFHSPTGSALHTESTTNIDSDEALSSSGRFDRDASMSFYSPDHLADSRKNSGVSQTVNQRDMYQSPNSTYNYSSTPQLLWTQPIKKQQIPAPAHTHTKSYDIASLSPGGPPYTIPPYMCPYDSRISAPMSYYPPYMEGEYQWDEQMGYVDPYYMSSTMAPCYSPEAARLAANANRSGKKGVRKKNPEPEANKAMYTISLDEILNKKDMRTTIMVKNIPNKYNQKMLLKKIDENHKRLYDFFYLPIDFKVQWPLTIGIE